MDRERALAALREAEKNIADSRLYIRRQREIIAYLASGGRDTTAAEAALADFRRGYSSQIAVREQILREMRAAETARAVELQDNAAPKPRTPKRRVRRTPYGIH